MAWPPLAGPMVEWQTVVAPDSNRRGWCVSIVLPVSGLGARDVPPGRRQAYLDLVGPGETIGMRRDMLTMSGCGLVARGILRLWGVRHARLMPPYRIGAAIEDVRLVAVANDALVVPIRGVRQPAAGDIVLHGHVAPKAGEGALARQRWRLNWGGEAHMFMVTAWGGTALATLDGGQVDQTGQQCILTRRRPMQWRGEQLWIGDRRVQWYVDVTKLSFAEPPTQPIVV